MNQNNGKNSSTSREKAILFAVIRAEVPEWRIDDQLDELAALAETAGAEVVYKIKQRRMKPDAATFIGEGKATEIGSLCRRYQANLAISDDDLTPVQVRNLERKIPAKVIDRSGLILDIFARRAQTREAKVQVELAQLEYYLPRLTRQWEHLRSSQGGIGFRGPGETQLEVDRRVIRKKISHLREELEKIARQRQTRRQGRKHTPTAALIGYTNVGKSTLLNTLSRKNDAFVEDRLFATLDPKVRKCEPSPGHPILVIDTVGFIRKLPHHLVASFRSTLEEAKQADLLVHLVDISHPLYEEQLRQTEIVLKELGVEGLPQILVFNKIDRLQNPGLLNKARDKYPAAIFLSAMTGLRVWELEQRLESLLYLGNKEVEILVEPDKLELLASMNDSVQIFNKAWEEGKVRVLLSGKPADVEKALSVIGV